MKEEFRTGRRGQEPEGLSKEWLDWLNRNADKTNRNGGRAENAKLIPEGQPARNDDKRLGAI